jgi:hypothetical protein
MDRRSLPQRYQGIFPLGFVGCLVGIAVSSLFASSLVFIGVGGGVGYLVGVLVALLGGSRLPVARLLEVERKTNLVLGIIGLVLGGVGAYASFQSGRTVIILSTLFFLAGGFYLISRHDK